MFDPVLDLDAGRCLPLLLDVAVKSLIVSAAALAALPALRRASAATRHLVLLAGLGVLLGLPALMPLLPRQPLPLRVNSLSQFPRAEPLGFNSASPRLRGRGEESNLLPAQAGSRFSKAQGFSPGKKGGAAAPPPFSPLSTQRPPAAAPSPPVRPAWLVLGWLLGVLACASRFLAAQARVRRLTRRCPPLPPSLLSAGPEAGDFAVRKTGPAGTPPMVWGWLRPTLLLPPEATQWPPARRRAVVLHESAHVRRQDWLTQTLAQAACALYWFNPLVWLLAVRMGAEAERACDDAVLLSGVPPTEYAQDLLAVACSLGANGAARRASVGAVTMARRSPVRGRLEAILDARRPRRRLTRRAAALALGVAFAVAAPLASLRPAARADAPVGTQAAPPAGVPTEADIARAQQHLHDLEQARADYAAAHPNTLTPAQIAQIDQSIQLTELKRGYDNFDERMKADIKRGRAEAKKPHTKKEREWLWGPIFAYERRPPSVLKRQRDFNAFLAQLKSKVDAFPVEQVARETRIYAFDSKIALDRTRAEAMQMEQAEGYSLHLSEDDITSMTDLGFHWEKDGQVPRADTVHVFLLFSKLKQRRHLDDADIDSLTAILRETSKTPSVAHANVMGLFHRLPDASPAQRQKICEAVRPFLTSGDKWERKSAERVMKKFGGSAPTPLPSQKGQAAPATAIAPVRPQPVPQANQTGVSAMTPLRTMKATLLKTTLLKTAALATGLTLPIAHAASAKPKAQKAAPPAVSASALKPAALAATAPDALHWSQLILQHTPVATVRALTSWNRGGALPEGVDRVYFLMSNNAVLIHATPAGCAHMEEIVNAIGVAP